MILLNWATPPELSFHWIRMDTLLGVNLRKIYAFDELG
ncbi:hypothetical protein SAMN05421636_102118 [Pricia antarctica]|uniref:Uncharacterized protein n=1 Tax=Pricia antarctica TaxID=641691 RepID=A0A1G6Y5B3_9FLAO|nr:hypothetical protein SAMN05421636_102118 [Pricia antarctica]